MSNVKMGMLLLFTEKPELERLMLDVPVLENAVLIAAMYCVNVYPVVEFEFVTVI
jgi:hypothetical protein